MARTNWTSINAGNSPDLRSTGLQLVIDSRATVSRLADHGRQIVANIFNREECVRESGVWEFLISSADADVPAD